MGVSTHFISGTSLTTLRLTKKSTAMNFLNLKHLPVFPALLALLIMFVLVLNLYILLTY